MVLNARVLRLLGLGALLWAQAAPVNAQDSLRVDVVAAGAFGVHLADRCESGTDTIGCTRGTPLSALELAVEVRPRRWFGVGAFAGWSRSLDQGGTASSDGEFKVDEPDHLLRAGAELKLHPFAVLLEGAYVGAELGWLRFSGASEQSAALVGGSLGYDFTLLRWLLVGVGARVEYFALDVNATGSALSTNTTAYAPGVCTWLGVRAGVTFGGH